MAATQVGWIGLGSIGIGMSKNLQKYLSSVSAPPLIYTNRTLSRGESLAALGAVPVQSAGEVAKKSDIIFSCVSNNAVLQQVADDIVTSGNVSGKVYVDCLTVHPDTSIAVSKKITDAEAEFIANKFVNT